MATTTPALISEPQNAPPEIQFTPDEIAVLAYTLWQDRGCPDGCPDDDWYEAERRLKAQAGQNRDS